MEIISREFINPNIKYYDGADLKLNTIKDFNDTINFWKMIFHEGYGLRAGDIVSFFSGAVTFSYTAAFFAAAELGLQLLTPPEKPLDASGRTAKLDRMLGAGKIDLCVIDFVCKQVPELVAMANYYSKLVVDQEIFDTYTIKDDSQFESVSNLIVATPATTILTTTSSGTTGEPKLVEYTHQQLYKICARNSRVFNFAGQTVCHTRNMHHAFVLMVNFLPTLHVADNHYTLAVNIKDEDHIENFVKFLMDHSISKMSLSNKPMLDNILSFMIDNHIQFKHSIDLIVGGFYITEDYIDKIKQVNVRQLISNFGSNETLGPILLRYVTQATPVIDYKMNYVGTPPDDFYKLELSEQHLHVQCPALYSGTIVMGDILSGDLETGFYHHGRNNFYRINEIDFSLSDLNDVVQQSVKGNFDICVDLPYQRLYLATWDSVADISTVNRHTNLRFGPNLSFSATEQLDKNIFHSEFKLDQDALRNYFRSKLQ